MRKEIEYSIPFVDETGQPGKIDLTLSFVPNIAIRMYNDIIGVVRQVQKTWDEMQYAAAEMAALDHEKPEGWKNKKREIEIKYLKLGESIREKGDQYFFNKRLELVFLLLKKNGVTDERYFNPEFWDACVDPSDILEFINAAVWKDDSKKKQQ